MPETWLPVVGYEGRYSVSSLGRVRSENYHREGRAQVLAACANKDGYQFVLLYSGKGRRKHCSVHVLVAQAFFPKDPDRPMVNHKDGVPANNRDANLEWCTHQENMDHARLMGLIPPQKKGGDHHSSAWFVVTSPAGEKQTIKGLNAFCKANGLLQGEMSNVVTGRAKTHRGWKCQRLNTGEDYATAQAG